MMSSMSVYEVVSLRSPPIDSVRRPGRRAVRWLRRPRHVARGGGKHWHGVARAGDVDDGAEPALPLDVLSVLLAEEEAIAAEHTDRHPTVSCSSDGRVVAAERRIVGRSRGAGERDEGSDTFAVVGRGEEGGGERDGPFGAQGFASRSAGRAGRVIAGRTGGRGGGLRIRTGRSLRRSGAGAGGTALRDQHDQDGPDVQKMPLVEGGCRG